MIDEVMCGVHDTFDREGQRRVRDKHIYLSKDSWETHTHVTAHEDVIYCMNRS